MNRFQATSKKTQAQPVPGYSPRFASEEDIPALLALEKSVHLSPWNRQNLMGELQKPYSKILVVSDDETDEQIIAYIVCWKMFDELNILNLAVDPAFRRKGLAHFLVRKVVGEAYKDGIRKVLLDVRKSNLAALGLYQSLGFVITHLRKEFYSNGEDGYQMALYMDESEVIQF